jgi:hypothetical protein
MATVPESGALPSDPSRANDYDSFAEAYTVESDAGDPRSWPSPGT